MRFPIILSLSIGAVGAGPAAGDVWVEVSGLRSAEGVVRVAICPEESFTTRTCPHVGSAPASAPRVRVSGVPDGVYAVQAFHDEDGDGDLARRGLRPTEGLAFSNGARMRRGPPRFSDAAIRVAGDVRVPITMRYYR